MPNVFDAIVDVVVAAREFRAVPLVVAAREMVVVPVRAVFVALRDVDTIGADVRFGVIALRVTVLDDVRETVAFVRGDTSADVRADCVRPTTDCFA